MIKADSVEEAFDELLIALSACIFCESQEVHNRIIIPVTMVSFVVVASPVEGDNSQSGKPHQSIRGAGGGVGILPVGALIIDKDLIGPAGVEYEALQPEGEAESGKDQKKSKKNSKSIIRLGL